MNFTPQQLHYFKRELITEEIRKELQLLIDSPDISPITTKHLDNNHSFPFLRYIFHHFIIEFPLLKHTQDDGDDFWPKCKLFLDEFHKSQLDAFYTPRQSESAVQRRIIKHKIEKSIVFAFCASIKTTQGIEESIRIHDLHSPPNTPPPDFDQNNTIQINIVSVRQQQQAKIKKSLLVIETSHAEFIVFSTFCIKKKPVYVARRHGDFRRLRDQLRRQHKHWDIPLIPSKSNTSTKEQGFRENDRLLLRAWLNELIDKNPDVQNSQVLLDFLTAHPLTDFVPDDKDSQQRQLWDQQRLKDQQRYREEVERRVYELNDALDELKKQVLEPGGLLRMFEAIKTTPHVHDLPASLKKAFEWGRINFAFVLHKHFIGSDTAVDNVDKLRKTHALMPYKTLSVILRFSNPMSMVKGVLDLFLAQPFGGKSLLQRMIVSNLSDESKVFQKDIKVLEEKINDTLLCEKLYNAVRTRVPKDSNYYNKACKTKILELVAILGNDEIHPVIPSDKEIDSQQTNHLLALWELYTKQHEHELLQNLFFQGLTGELIKEFISVFYQPLAQVYKAADISTTIRHAATFVDDLLQLVDKIVQKQDKNSVQLFIDLVQRHEQHFYTFVHKVHSQQASTVFDELICYLDRLFTFVAEGIPGKIDMNRCIENAGLQSKEALKELEQEINAVCDYRYQQKVYRFERQKRKMQQSTTLQQEEEEEAFFQFLPKHSEVINALDEFEDFDDSKRKSSSESSQLSYAGIDFPQLTLIPKILPYFIKDIMI